MESKGTFGGACDRTTCQNGDARFWHPEMRRYYCLECARQINATTTPPPINLFVAHRFDLDLPDLTVVNCPLPGAVLFLRPAQPDQVLKLKKLLDAGVKALGSDFLEL